MHIHDEQAHRQRHKGQRPRRERPRAPELCRPSPVVRTRYFYSMLLEAEDLAVDQRFHLETARRHVAELHGWGTVCGLRVRDNDCPFQVEIDPGVAIDCLGREIRVAGEPLIVSLEEAVREVLEKRKKQAEHAIGVPVRQQPQEQQRQRPEEPQRPPHRRDCEWVRLFIGLCYSEHPERPVQSIGGPETCCEPGCENSRIRHGACVYVSDDPPPEQDDPLTDLGLQLDGCGGSDLRDWLCEKILCGCPACPPDPCGEHHHCITLASVQVSDDGEVYRPDNCTHRRLLLPTRLIAELAMYAVQEVKKP